MGTPIRGSIVNGFFIHLGMDASFHLPIAATLLPDLILGNCVNQVTISSRETQLRESVFRLVGNGVGKPALLVEQLRVIDNCLFDCGLQTLLDSSRIAEKVDGARLSPQLDTVSTMLDGGQPISLRPINLVGNLNLDAHITATG